MYNLDLENRRELGDGIFFRFVPEGDLKKVEQVCLLVARNFQVKLMC